MFIRFDKVVGRNCGCRKSKDPAAIKVQSTVKEFLHGERELGVAEASSRCIFLLIYCILYKFSWMYSVDDC